MKNFIALGAAFLLSTATVFADDSKPQPTPVATRYRQLVLEQLRDDMVKAQLAIYLCGSTMSDEDINNITGILGSQQEKMGESLQQGVLDLNETIVTLGGKNMEDTYTSDKLETMIPQAADTAQKVATPSP